MSKYDVSELIYQYGDILAHFFNHVSDMVFLMEVEDSLKFRYVMANPSAMRVANLSEESYGKLIEDVCPADKAAFLNSKYQESVLEGKPVSFVEHGEMIGESTLTPIFNEHGICTHVFSVTRDVTEQKKLEEQLQFMAYHDVLTGMPNRRLLIDRLEQAIATAKRQQQIIGVLYFDCDYFKRINDTLGHDVGDEFLQGVAKRLTYCIRNTDTIARIGGDEFVIVLTSINHPSQVEKVAQRVLDTLEEPWYIKQHQFQITTSIGISLYPEDGQEIEHLLRHADQALYQAKAEGRNRYMFYSSLNR